VEWTVPVTTMPALLDRRAALDGDRLAVVDGPVRMSFSELVAQARAVAGGLATRGVERGDRVAVWAPNGCEWVVAACGIWYRGATLVPINTRFRAVDAGEILAASGATALFVSSGFLGADYVGMLRAEFGPPRDGRPFARLPALRTLVVLGAADGPGAGAGPPLAEVLAAAGAEAPFVPSAVDRHDECEILFTSGTTGQPKGVVLSHESVLQSYHDYGVLAGFDAGDRYLGVMPWGHGGGLNGGVVSCLVHGMTMVPLPVFEPDAALQLIEAEQISILLGPPQLWNLLLQAPARPAHDLSSLRVALTGAAAVPPTLIEELHGLGIERVINAYGCIETCVISMTRADDPIDVVATSTGRALPGMEVQIADDDGRDVPAGQPGEILVRGYGLMTGYLDPAQTAAAVDGDGWFHTGDVGIVDAAGAVRVVDRKKEVFHVGGFNVYPAEVEGFLARHPTIAAVAVIGVPDDRLGEVGLAFVVPTPGGSVDAVEIREWAGRSIANYKVPRDVVVLEELPLNPTGKTDKARLRDMAAARPGVAS
jgi:HIP---CoA ligase